MRSEARPSAAKLRATAGLGSVEDVRCRPAVVEDLPFLATMLGEAAVWRPDKATPTADEVMADPTAVGDREDLATAAGRRAQLHGDDDLAPNATLHQVADRGGGLGERIRPVDGRSKLPFFEE